MKPATFFKSVALVVVVLAFAAGHMARHTAAQTPKVDLEVKRAVVRIVPIRCFGGSTCRPQPDQPGSGVIIHPSGLILTAWHVLSQDNNFQEENYWDDFSIELIGMDDSVPPEPSLRARIVATRPEADLAILRIDRDATGAPVSEAAIAALPWLPVFRGEESSLDAGNTQLHILGYPKPPLPDDPTTLSTNQNLTLNRRNRLLAELEVQLLFDRGYSGGPALTLREGRLEVVGLVLASVGNRTKLRDLSIEFDRLLWRPGEEDFQADPFRLQLVTVGSADFLQLDGTIFALGLANVPLELQLLFFEAGNRQPWRPTQVDLPRLAGRQVYWPESLRPLRPVHDQTLSVRIPLAGVQTSPDRLLFRVRVTRLDTGVQLWSDDYWYEAQAAATVAPTATATRTITPTRPSATATGTSTGTPTPSSAPMELQADTARAIAGIDFVYVPAGEFLMGSADGYTDERPVHTVDLDGFWIMRTEVTNAQYRAFVDAGGYATQRFWTADGWEWRTENNVIEPFGWSVPVYNGDTQPAVGVSWYEAVAFANWLAEESGFPVRLPTEAEWEKAARGESGRVYPWGDVWDRRKANYGEGDDGFNATAPVGSFPDGASPYAALDMAGNAWEWVADWYDKDYYSRSPAGNPTGPEAGTLRILRGGSRGINSFDLRTAVRLEAPPSKREKDVGFRLALSAARPLTPEAGTGAPPPNTLATIEAGVRATLTASAPTTTPLAPTTTPTPTPTVTPTLDPAAQIAAAVAATLTALAPAPTATPTPSPSPTHTATANARGTFQAAVEATLTASAPTSTPSPPPTLTATPTNAIAPGAVRLIEGIPFGFVPTGSFVMGSAPADIEAAVSLCLALQSDCEHSRFADETPAHEVYVDAFWLGRTEVTNSQFLRFVEANGYTTRRYWSDESWHWLEEAGVTTPARWDDPLHNHPLQPVAGISWYEAVAFTNWLTQESGLEIRLPTEAEWEKAARGDTGSRLFPWGNEWDPGKANYCDSMCDEQKDTENSDGYAVAAPVGRFRLGDSPYGFQDMAGNAWEWTLDVFNSGYYAESPTYNPTGPEGGAARSMRGGSWRDVPRSLRAANRGSNLPDSRSSNLGFRLLAKDKADAEPGADDEAAATTPDFVYGQTISGKIDPTVEVDTYRFVGSRGDILLVRAARQSGGIDPTFVLYRTDGSEVCGHDSGVSSVVEGVCTLDRDGEHRVVISDYRSNDTGDYTFIVLKLNPPDNPVEIDYRRPINGVLSQAVEVDVYVFTGQEGDVLIIRVSRDSGSMDPTFVLRQADGAVVCETANSRLSSLAQATCMIDASGEYYLLINDQGSNDTGRYSLFVQPTN